MNKSQSTGMYVILAIMVLAFVSMLFSGPTTVTKELSYTEFMQKLSASEIKSVQIDKDMVIAIPKVQPKAEKPEKSAKKDINPLYGEQKTPTLQYKVLTPNDPQLIKKLEDAKVDVNVKKASE